MKYLLIILISLLTTHSYSQVYKYKAFQTNLSYIDKGGKDVYPNPWDSTDILVVWNVGKNKIKIYADKEQDIDIIKWLDTKKDDQGNAWITYQAVDKKGTDCKAQILLYKQQVGIQSATLFIEYPEGSLVYRLKTDE